MFAEYVKAAMKRANYEVMEDGDYFATIPGFEGLWASAGTLEVCRDELESTLEEWLVLGLWLNDETLPVLGKLDLVPRKLARKLARKRGAGLPSRTRKAS
jgi:predicted RNase H-like HicB family nuclease